MTALPWSWMRRGACRKPGTDRELFFGADFEKQADREARETLAKAICAGCPVRVQCLDWAVSSPEKAGVWGGMGEDERALERRRQVRRERGRAA